MANIKSARKRARQSEEHRKRNASHLSAMRTAIKTLGKAVAAGDKAAATAALSRSMSTVDRTASKGVIHRNVAARAKRQLAHALKSLG
ncbi:MAG: 30S ribosomal protein S20 [Betaproteobacteria bacterium]|nr:30S ribosomal protein S20 [Betaproteobacteria bacterium]